MIRSKRNFMAALFGTVVMLPTFRFPTPQNVYDHLKCCWTWYETGGILNAMPRKKDGIEARSGESFTVLADSRCRDLFRLNPMAARIWDLCDGRTSVDAMVRTMSGDYDVAPGVCAGDIVLALAEFKRKGLISC